MKTNYRYTAICIIIVLSLFAGKANAKTTDVIRDSVCCTPDSLKVVSTNYPVFCVSWVVPFDSSCKRPYGFEIEWRQFPGSFPWNSRIIIYAGGTLITFCDSVSICGGYQWRVRTICDSLGGTTTYSDWIYGNKFSMVNCLFDGVLNFTEDFKNKQNPAKDKSTLSRQAIKPKEN